MQVKVFDLCEPCGKLCEDVETREHTSYYPASYKLKLKCCAPCFEAAKRNAAAEASGLLVC